MEENGGGTYRNESDWPVDELMFVLAELSTVVLRLLKGKRVNLRRDRGSPCLKRQVSSGDLPRHWTGGCSTACW